MEFTRSRSISHIFSSHMLPISVLSPGCHHFRKQEICSVLPLNSHLWWYYQSSDEGTKFWGSFSIMTRQHRHQWHINHNLNKKTRFRDKRHSFKFLFLSVAVYLWPFLLNCKNKELWGFNIIFAVLCIGKSMHRLGS